jgi:hypothetical protein
MTQEDDLTVARRAHTRALEKAIQLRMDLLEVLKDIERAERALKRGKLDSVATSCDRARDALSRLSARGMQVRIGDKATCEPSIDHLTHRFVGLRRPPVPPASPQELDCSAIVCGCHELLYDRNQIRQHWETGCFDLPEFEMEPLSEDFAELLKELESEDK